MAFTTKDRDHDQNGGNCAVTYTGAWCYSNCYNSNQKGKYLGEKHGVKGAT